MYFMGEEKLFSLRIKWRKKLWIKFFLNKIYCKNLDYHLIFICLELNFGPLPYYPEVRSHLQRFFFSPDAESPSSSYQKPSSFEDFSSQFFELYCYIDSKFIKVAWYISPIHENIRTKNLLSLKHTHRRALTLNAYEVLFLFKGSILNQENASNLEITLRRF